MKRSLTTLAIVVMSATAARCALRAGIFVGGGGTVRIQRVVGTTVMMDMMLTGRLLSASEGLQEHIVR